MTLTAADLAALDAMIDNDLLARRRAVYEAACARRTQATADMAQATKALSEAEQARADLIQGAARGEAVSPQQTAEAERKVREAETRLIYLRDLIAALDGEWRRTHDALGAAHHDAAKPIIEHAAKLRTAAAERLDRARAELSAAEGEYDRATQAAEHGCARGYRPKHPVSPGFRMTSWNDTPSSVAVRLSAAAEAEWWGRVGITAPTGAAQEAA